MCMIVDVGCSVFFFFKQKTAYEVRISDWSSDVCSSDLELVRRLRDAGATVQVAMTEGALHFVGTPTFQAVSGLPVRTSLWDAAAEAAMGHIELARWADRIVVAPATADTLAKLAHGFADDLVTTLCLDRKSTRLNS